MSRPGAARLAKVKRSASVPKAGMPSGNSLRVRFSIDRPAAGPSGSAVRFHQRPRADAVDQVERIEHVALRLRHLLAFRVAHEAVHIDVAERDLPVKCRVIITMRATQKKMMSKPVTSTDGGQVEIERRIRLLRVVGVQSSVENGHSADENQVSSTSSSRDQFARVAAGGGLAPVPRPRRARRRRCRRRRTTPESGGPTTAGARCTSPGCC
jgi:hypothetical protein